MRIWGIFAITFQSAVTSYLLDFQSYSILNFFFHTSICKQVVSFFLIKVHSDSKVAAWDQCARKLNIFYICQNVQSIF